MPHSKLTLSFVSFALIWSGWSVWITVQPVLSSAQIAILFTLLPVSVLLLALSFFDNEDGDDDSNGTPQAIFLRVKP